MDEKKKQLQSNLMKKKKRFNDKKVIRFMFGDVNDDVNINDNDKRVEKRDKNQSINITFLMF